MCEAQEMYWRNSLQKSVFSLMCVGKPLKNPCLTILGKSGHLEISWLPESNSGLSYQTVWLAAFIGGGCKHWMSGMFARARVEALVLMQCLQWTQMPQQSSDYIFSLSNRFILWTLRKSWHWVDSWTGFCMLYGLLLWFLSTVYSSLQPYNNRPCASCDDLQL